MFDTPFAGRLHIGERISQEIGGRERPGAQTTLTPRFRFVYSAMHAS